MKALKPLMPPKNSSPLVLWYQAPRLNSLELEAVAHAVVHELAAAAIEAGLRPLWCSARARPWRSLPDAVDDVAGQPLRVLKVSKDLPAAGGG
jgi:hypothetical protein